MTANIFLDEIGIKQRTTDLKCVLEDIVMFSISHTEHNKIIRNITQNKKKSVNIQRRRGGALDFLFKIQSGS